MTGDPAGAGRAWTGRLLVVLFPGAQSWPLTTFLRGLGAEFDARDDALAPWPDPVDGRLIVRIAPPTCAPDLAVRLPNDHLRVLLLVRDPRDAAAAHVSPGNDRLPEPVVKQIEMLRGWRDHPGVVVVRYEDICSPAVGGDEARQVAALVTLAAVLGWRGSGFRLVRAILDTHATSGDEDRASLVGIGAVTSSGVPADAAVTLQALALEWGYAEVPRPPRNLPQGPLGGLLAALANEHEHASEALARQLEQVRQDAVATRAELRKVEDAARLVQQRLAEERNRFRPVRTAAGYAASVIARVRGLIRRG